MRVNVKHDLLRLERELALYPQELFQAGIRAKNRAVTTVRAEGSREMAKIYPGLKIGSLKAQMKLERATRPKPVASVAFSGKRFRLLGNWVNTQTKRGVRLGSRAPWRIETLDGTVVTPEVIRHAFIQRSHRGAAHVWIRVGDTRYPITALLASSVASAFADKGIGALLVRLGHARFTVAFAQEARFVTLKRRGGGTEFDFGRPG